MTKENINNIQNLLVRVIDSAEGYSECAEEAKNTRFEKLFEGKAQERREFAVEIRNYLREHDKDVENDSSLLAGAHRLYVDLKSKISNDDEGVLEEIIRGESKLVETYEDTIPGIDPQYSILQTLKRQLSKVSQDLNEAKTMEKAA